MRARALAAPFPTVSFHADVLDAARVLAEQKLPGLIVVDDRGMPYTVLPGSQVLRFVVPQYVQDDPALARAYDEKAADALCQRMTERQVHELLPHPPRDVDDSPVVDGDATAIEVAAVMARLRSPIVAVVENGKILGAITVSMLLEYLLRSASAA
jgi:CBS domain-containing protein